MKSRYGEPAGGRQQRHPESSFDTVRPQKFMQKKAVAQELGREHPIGNRRPPDGLSRESLRGGIDACKLGIVVHERLIDCAESDRESIPGHDAIEFAQECAGAAEIFSNHGDRVLQFLLITRTTINYVDNFLLKISTIG